MASVIRHCRSHTLPHLATNPNHSTPSLRTCLHTHKARVHIKRHAVDQPRAEETPQENEVSVWCRCEPRGGGGGAISRIPLSRHLGLSCPLKVELFTTAPTTITMPFVGNTPITPHQPRLGNISATICGFIACCDGARARFLRGKADVAICARWCVMRLRRCRCRQIRHAADVRERRGCWGNWSEGLAWLLRWRW